MTELGPACLFLFCLTNDLILKSLIWIALAPNLFSECTFCDIPMSTANLEIQQIVYAEQNTFATHTLSM